MFTFCSTLRLYANYCRRAVQVLRLPEPARAELTTALTCKLGCVLVHPKPFSVHNMDPDPSHWASVQLVEHKPSSIRWMVVAIDVSASLDVLEALRRYLEGTFSVFCMALVDGKTTVAVNKDRQRWAPPPPVAAVQQTLGLDTTQRVSPQENHLKVFLTLRALLRSASEARLTFELQDSEESGGNSLDTYRRVLAEWIGLNETAVDEAMADARLTPSSERTAEQKVICCVGNQLRTTAARQRALVGLSRIHI